MPRIDAVQALQNEIAITDVPTVEEGGMVADTVIHLSLLDLARATWCIHLNAQVWMVGMMQHSCIVAASQPSATRWDSQQPDRVVGINADDL